MSDALVVMVMLEVLDCLNLRSDDVYGLADDDRRSTNGDGVNIGGEVSNLMG